MAHEFPSEGASPRCGPCEFRRVCLVARSEQTTRRLDIIERRRLRADVDIFRAGEATDSLAILCAGWAIKYATLPNKRRQTLQFFIPGDVLDLDAAIVPGGNVIFSTRTLTAVELAYISVSQIRAAAVAPARERRAIVAELRSHLALKGRHLIDLGQRRAIGRVAAQLLELRERWLTRRPDDKETPFPMRQEDFADAIGLSAAHLNRTLGSLREEGILSIDDGLLRIHDFAALKAMAEFY